MAVYNFNSILLCNQAHSLIGMIKKIDRNGFTTWITIGKATDCSYALIVDTIGYYCYDTIKDLNEDVRALQYHLNRVMIHSYRIEMDKNADSDLVRAISIPLLNRA